MYHLHCHFSRVQRPSQPADMSCSECAKDTDSYECTTHLRVPGFGDWVLCCGAGIWREVYEMPETGDVQGSGAS